MCSSDLEAELVSDVPCKAGQGHDTAVGKTNADHAFVVLAAALLHDHRRYPMRVVEWQMSSLQRLLPRWRTRLLVELLNYVSEIRFDWTWPAESSYRASPSCNAASVSRCNCASIVECTV